MNIDSDSQSGDTQETPIIIDDEETTDEVRPGEGSYLDKLSYRTPLGTKEFFITITYPGGLTADHLARLHVKLTQGIPRGPVYFLGSIEGGDGVTHQHVHLITWESAHDSGEGRRTDSVSRSYRDSVFSDDDTAHLGSTAHLVRTRKVSDLTGALRYLYKGTPLQHLGYSKCPPDLDFDRVVEDGQQRAAAVAAQTLSDDSVFPLPGKLKTIPPSQVSDFLIKAAAELRIDLSIFNTFGRLCHHCYRRGVRFDLSKLRSYKLGTDMISADPETFSAAIIQHQVEWRASN